MEALNIDYIGPFPEDEYGNTYVLTVIDTFSRAIGLYARSTVVRGNSHGPNVDPTCGIVWLPESDNI
jgi:hypothetical protein